MLNHERRLTSLALRHLPPAVAEQWIGLIRPALRLRSCGRNKKPIGQLGGFPSLPDDLGWPQWQGKGSLHFVASIDCGRVPSNRLDIPLPDQGMLYFFYFDADRRYLYGPPEDRSKLPDAVWQTEPETADATRVIYVPAGTPTIKREPPEDIDSYLEVGLEADIVATGPCSDHPAFAAAIQRLSGADRAYLQDFDNLDRFREAMDHGTGHDHRIGGHADPVQNAVEMDVARSLVAGAYDSAAMRQEASRWTLLVQIDSDEEADMQWGDVGTLYWLMRPDDLAARRFQTAYFTGQLR
ncbi:YwqG family protein [Actinopolymorpha sp. B9G3]|uniref:YwqG family protein n=1 Tax=Actinopolymorpha sp. B9G3 TaxID=3158970 RepID=UPI0032D90733